MDTASLPRYTYSPLKKETREIRLIKLLPGISDQPLYVNLTAAPLPPPQPETSRRLTLGALRSTLPDGWEAHETLEGRYVFHCSQSEEVVWKHPDPAFDSALYDVELEIDGQKCLPCYEALSYVWGKPDKSHHVIVVDENARSPTQLQITTNLYLALMHLRVSDRTRTLWVDAVCINQEDLTERSEQVQRMAAIYAQAYRVVVWLGEEADDSKLALDRLKYIGEQGIVTKSNFGYRSPEAQEPEWYLATCDIPYPSRVWNAVFHLLGRSCFERLWIFQEIQLANSRSVLQCGFDEIPWPMFRSAVLCLKEKNQVFTPDITPLLRQVFPLCLEWRDESFPLMLNAILQRKCTDEKDFVYALLGLVPSKFAALIVPDYRLSCGEIYKGVFLKHLKYTGRLELLAFGGRGGELGAPTWTPNWLAKRQYRPNRGLATGMSPAAQQDPAMPSVSVTPPAPPSNP
ncbi:Heterokaryon incompatibility protein 6, OR allele [Madurella fahalii]|uniref:Heterokaryon incompatibility protein 6, OR allele n=1 Tax=Madurella fahalii TaxID=1157608 RepID=A0ABQ0G9L0_9PEZI